MICLTLELFLDTCIGVLISLTNLLTKIMFWTFIKYISVKLYKQPMVVDGQKGLTRLRNTIETKRFFGCFHNLNFVGLLSFTFFYLHFSVIYMFKLQQLLTSLVSIHCLATPQVFQVPTTRNYKLPPVSLFIPSSVHQIDWSIPTCQEM